MNSLVKQAQYYYPPPPPPRRSVLGTAAKVALGVGALGLIGAGAKKMYAVGKTKGYGGVSAAVEGAKSTARKAWGKTKKGDPDAPTTKGVADKQTQADKLLIKDDKGDVDIEKSKKRARKAVIVGAGKKIPGSVRVTKGKWTDPDVAAATDTVIDEAANRRSRLGEAGSSTLEHIQNLEREKKTKKTPAGNLAGRIDKGRAEKAKASNKEAEDTGIAVEKEYSALQVLKTAAELTPETIDWGFWKSEGRGRGPVIDWNGPAARPLNSGSEARRDRAIEYADAQNMDPAVKGLISAEHNRTMALEAVHATARNS